MIHQFQNSDTEAFEERDFSVKMKHITETPKYQNPSASYLDYVEDECWRLFKKYAEFIGAEIGDGVDFSIVKELSEKFMAVVEKTFGIEFPVRRRG